MCQFYFHLGVIIAAVDKCACTWQRIIKIGFLGRFLQQIEILPLSVQLSQRGASENI